MQSSGWLSLGVVCTDRVRVEHGQGVLSAWQSQGGAGPWHVGVSDGDQKQGLLHTGGNFTVSTACCLFLGTGRTGWVSISGKRNSGG